MSIRLLLLLALLPATRRDETVATKDRDLQITVPSDWKPAAHPEASLFLTCPGDEYVLAIAHPMEWNASLAATIDAWLADTGRVSASRKGHPFGERVVTRVGYVEWDSVFYARRSFAWEVRHVRKAEASSAAFERAIETLKLGQLPPLPDKITAVPTEGSEQAFIAEADRMLAEWRPATADSLPALEGTAGAYARGIWFLRMNEAAKAVTELKRVLDAAPRFALARSLYALAVLRMPANSRDEIEKNAATALAEATAARTQDGTLAWPYLVVAQLERRKAYLENPKGVGSDVVERVLAPLNTAAELPNPPPETWRMRAEVGELLKLTEPAMLDYGRWLEVHPADQDARERRDKLRAALGVRRLTDDPFAEGLRRFRHHDFVGALEAFNAAPDSPSLRRFRSRAAAKVGDWGRVGEDTTIILLRDSSDAEVRELRAFALYRLGKWSAAALDMEALVRISPSRENELKPYLEACKAR